MQAGQANDAVGAAQSSQRIGQGVNDLADTDIGDLDYELDLNLIQDPLKLKHGSNNQDRTSY